MQHRYLSIAFVVVVAVVHCAASVNAAPVKIEIKGSGNTAAAAACTQIRNICELQAIGNTAASRADNYCLAKDVDASRIGTCGTGASFQPIGTSAQPFTGRFNGNGFNIRNLSIVISSAPKDAEVGLFGRVGESAFVHDVGLIDASIQVTSNIVDSQLYVGALAGTNIGRIQNAFATGVVTCSAISSAGFDQSCSAGGLVGGNAGTIKNVFAVTTMRGDGGTKHIGGLVGVNGNAIEFAYAIGPTSCVTSGHQARCSAGGLIGEGNSVGSLADLFATGSVHLGNEEVPCRHYCAGGGLIGGRGGPGETPLLRSFATGAVSCLGEERCYVGGLAGLLQTGPVSLTYATGSVSCDLAAPVCDAGGLVGLNGGRGFFLPLVLRSFAVGQVKCMSPDDAPGCFEGGLAGGSTIVGHDTTAKSYWDKDTSKQSTSEGGGTGLTTQELQSALPPEFDPAKWAISYGSSYPYLTAANRWIPAVRSPTRAFPSRVTSFWGSLALAETKQGRFAVFPAGQMFPWEYHAYDKQKVSASSKAASFAMLGRLIGSSKPSARAVYSDRKSDPLSLARIDYFMNANGKGVWPLTNPHLASGATFYAGPTPVEDPSGGVPAFFNRQDILTQLGNGRLVMLQGRAGGAGKHWMLVTAVMRDAGGNVTGIVANDPQLGQQVIIDMVQGSPTYRQVTYPADYQALSSFTFSATHYFSVAMN